MKKIKVLILTSAILLCWVSSTYAAEILGYPIVPKQARFYIIILSVIGVSMAMVAATYVSLWLVDLKKKQRVVAAKPALNSGFRTFGGHLAASAQSAK